MGDSFQLEVVLRHRRHCEDMARKMYADAVRELKLARGLQTRHENTRTEYRRAMRRKQETGGSAMEMQAYTRYLQRLDAEILVQRQRVGKLAGELEMKRRELMARLKDRQVLEKMKERHLAEEAARERAMEQKMLGEAAISRYRRRS